MLVILIEEQHYSWSSNRYGALHACSSSRCSSQGLLSVEADLKGGVWSCNPKFQGCQSLHRRLGHIIARHV